MSGLGGLKNGGGKPWSNWMKTMTFIPSNCYQPTTYAELRAVMQQAANEKKPLRVGGSARSWSPGPVPGKTPYRDNLQVDGYLVDLSELSPDNANKDSALAAKYFSDANGKTYVAIPPGTLQGWFADNMANDNDALHRSSNAHSPQALGTMGASPDINVCGFVANGCHGTGWNQPPAADQLVGVEVMTVNAAGQVVNLAFASNQALADAMKSNSVTTATPTVSPDAIGAARCSLGSLGVIVKAVVQTEPLYNVKERDDITPLGFIFPKNGDTSNLEKVVTSAGYTEIFWYPYTDELWIKRFSRTNMPTQRVIGRVAFDNVTAAMQDLTHDETGRWLDRFPRTTPIVMQLLWRSTKALLKNKPMRDPDFEKDFDPSSDSVVPVNKAFVFLDMHRFNNIADLEHTVPIPPKAGGGYDFRPVVMAWKAVIDKIEAMKADHKYPVNIIVHFRFLKNSNTPLSPCVWPIPDTHTCYIEIMTFSEQTDLFTEFCETVIPQWQALGGLPNWGKWFTDVPGATANANQKLRARSSLNSFLNVRAAADPTGMFLNDLVNQLIMGPPAAPQARAARKARAAPPPQGDSWTYKLPPGQDHQDYPEGGRIWNKAGWSFYQNVEAETAVLINPRGKPFPMVVKATPGQDTLVYTLVTDFMGMRSNFMFGQLQDILAEKLPKAP